MPFAPESARNATVDTRPPITPALDQARQNWSRNRAALRVTQPAFADRVSREPADADGWIFARDGSLTVRPADGWWQGCSLPTRSAAEQLRTLDVRGPVGCFLDPPHPAHLRVALDTLRPAQALVALVPDDAAMAVMVAAEDLSADIAAHRLWFAAGDGWVEQLRDLFRSNPGLPVPGQFVRLTIADAARIDPLIAGASAAFSAIGTERQAAIRALNAGWKPEPEGPRAICVMINRGFRLWDDARLALADVAASEATGPAASTTGPVAPAAIRGLCGDDPATASTLALLAAAVDAGALMSADTARVDLPNLLPTTLPWVTWVTAGRVPPFASAGPNDRLVVADPTWVERAGAAGWPADRVGTGAWPRWPEQVGTSNVEPSQPAGDSLTPRVSAGELSSVLVLCDTVLLDIPKSLDHFSSHQLLWNAIHQELSTDPYAVGTDADAYLTSRQHRVGVNDEALDRDLFLRSLIEPAVAQGIVRRLRADGVAVRAAGEGWADIAEFRQIAIGPVRSRAGVGMVAATATALLDVRPSAFRNGLYSPGKPVIRCCGRTHLAVRQDISAALAGRLAPPPVLPPISVAKVLDVLRGTWSS